MRAEQVTEKILSEARQEAERIVGEARRQVQERQKAFEQESAAFEQETEQLVRRSAEDKQARMLAAARMELRKKILAAKRDLLDEVFEKTYQRLNHQQDSAYLDLMGRLLMQAVVTGDEEVVVGKNETRINQDFLKQINKRLGPGYKGNLRLSSERAELDGGFLLRRGKVQVNCSLKVLLEQIRERIEMELAEKLFGNG